MHRHALPRTVAKTSALIDQLSCESMRALADHLEDDAKRVRLQAVLLYHRGQLTSIGCL